MARDVCLASGSSAADGGGGGEGGATDDIPAESHSHFRAMGLDVRLALGGNLDDKMARYTPIIHT